MTLFNLLSAGLLVGATLVLSGGSGEIVIEKQRFVARDEKGQVIATVIMEQPLPAHNTSLAFDGPPAPGHAVLVEPMTFEDAGEFQCHWSKLIIICKTAEQEPAETRLVSGGYVRRLDAETVIVSDAPGDGCRRFLYFS